MGRKPKKKFKAHSHAPFKHKDAQAIGEELEEIKSKGSLTPERILQKAKQKNSVMHQYVEWNDKVASHQWRIEQVRKITRHIIEVTVIKGKEVEQKAFFNVVGVESGEKEYVSLTEAITIPSYKNQLLKEMKAHLQKILELIELFTD